MAYRISIQTRPGGAFRTNARNNANTIVTPAAVSGRDMHATNLGTTIKGQAIPVADTGTAGRYTAGARTQTTHIWYKAMVSSVPFSM